MSPWVKDAVCRYGFAIASTVAVTWVRIFLSVSLEDRVPFALYYVSVLLTAWVGGSGPAVLALVMGIFATALWVIPPEGSLLGGDPAHLVALFVYGLVGVVAIVLFRRNDEEHALSQQHARNCDAMSKQLSDSDRRKDEFLALLAHELRNPLATLRTGIEYMERPNLESHKRREVRRSMRRQLEQLVLIVEDLLDVSRYLRGGLTLKREVIDLRDVIDRAIEMVRPQIDSNEHDLKFSRPAFPAAVNGDPLRLIQVVTNLLSNAAKYTPRQGRIRIFLDSEPTEMVLHVVDNGIGVALESQNAIFELFTQANASSTRESQGLGIGLALVKQLVEMHGGQAAVSSEGPGRGSRFTVRLPAADPALMTEPTPELSGVFAALPSPPPTDRGRPTRVLVVDDNVDAARTLASLLKLDGYAVRAAHDGCSGIEQACAFKPDVILLDIGMPGMDGYETARRIRAQRIDPRPTIVAVTGWGSDRDRAQSQAAGIDIHLVKPIDMAELNRAMATVDRGAAECV
ncbi:Autoinducer 2 sensor kinase/phosphatase LuxQ [Pirellulimonas nuda]|uniref:histidine kinase n=1 Tax=Pirellulimonas nuda TaxID=2528009 RepID=A0A518D6Y0_9BACT|nr:ATP-binding protein [Pirellulimonas nuda]QDU87206.1 Autoinducer 2 sensor kinase/phosphatase LuxQ [Pirellulimonas nuda]